MIMKVYLAAQTLSSSVANAIEFCDKILQLPEFKNSGPTVKFIRTVDRIFDFLSVRNPWSCLSLTELFHTSRITI